MRKIDEKFFKELNIEQLKGNMTYELIVKNDFKDDKCEINNEDCFKPQKIYFYCKQKAIVDEFREKLQTYGCEVYPILSCEHTNWEDCSCFKTGTINFLIRYDGMAVFCLDGGRNICIGDCNLQTISEIWSEIGTYNFKRKELFHRCVSKGGH